MKKNNRGVSPIIAWVLLVGFAVTLGVVVTQWTKTHAETEITETIKYVNTGLECDNIDFNVVYCNDLESVQHRFKIYNRGLRTITKFSLNIFSASGDITDEEIKSGTEEGVVSPGKSIIYALSSVGGETELSKVDLIPVITLQEGSLVGCKNKIISVTDFAGKGCEPSLLVVEP